MLRVLAAAVLILAAVGWGSLWWMRHDDVDLPAGYAGKTPNTDSEPHEPIPPSVQPAPPGIPMANGGTRELDPSPEMVRAPLSAQVPSGPDPTRATPIFGAVLPIRSLAETAPAPIAEVPVQASGPTNEKAARADDDRLDPAALPNPVFAGPPQPPMTLTPPPNVTVPTMPIEKPSAWNTPIPVPPGQVPPKP